MSCLMCSWSHGQQNNSATKGRYPQEEYTATHVLALHPAENTLYKMQEATLFCPLQAHFPEQKLEVLQFNSLNVKNDNGVFPPLNKFFP